MNSLLRSWIRYFENLAYARYAQTTNFLDFSKVQGPCLVIAPHPDDETLGCGAAILAARKESRDVTVVVITDGARSNLVQDDEKTVALERTKEVIAACARLNVPQSAIHFLNYPDKKTPVFAQTIAQQLEKIIAKVQPALILSPSILDRHPDHIVAAKAVASLCQQGKITCPVLEYPMWLSLRGLLEGILAPRLHPDTMRLNTALFLQDKARAFLEHRTQCAGATTLQELQAGIWASHFVNDEIFFLVYPENKTVDAP